LALRARESETLIKDEIIERYELFWSAAAQDANFDDQAKILRALVTYIKSEYGDLSNHVDLVMSKIEELDKYLPLMDLDQFCASSKAISYGKRSIRVSGSPNYASGLSRDISAEEQRQLTESINASDRDRTEGLNGEGDDAGNDLLDLDSDDA
jgi:hypothetical protein